ncbi:MAG: helix-turn-helix transcriptional regulator [Planctomycetaceae bacterium]|nr:helix-turn-helix transcriptional regulator [Planctomycetaceae bacterium]
MEKSVFTREYDVLRSLLREVRRRCSVTQVELAARLNETQSFVSKCERGERRLDLVQLAAFCQALHLPLVDFVQEYQQRCRPRPSSAKRASGRK